MELKWLLNRNSNFYWIVHGKRNDIIVEPNKKEVIVEGSGPYRWLK